MPDFILEINNKKLVIEVNGSHEPEYLERKKRTHELMSNLGDVISFDAYGADLNNQLSNKINQFIDEIKTFVLKVNC